MTRLDQTRRKKYYSKLGMYLFLFFLILIFFATIGLKLLVNTSLFITGLQHKTPNNENIGNLEAPPEITDIPNATNSATLTISGSAPNNKALTVFVNDEKQKEIITDENGFITDITLTEGNNSVYVEVTDKNTNQSKKSRNYTVVYKNKKPTLEISSPADNDKINTDEINVAGITDRDVSVKINDIPVVVSTSGNFSYTVKLQEGENKIHIEAHDDAGNIETKELTITYQRD